MAPEKKPKPIKAGTTLSVEVPEDVRADLERHPLAASVPTKVPAEQIPDDVLAEQDAEIRAARETVVDADLRPVALDEDSEY